MAKPFAQLDLDGLWRRIAEGDVGAFETLVVASQSFVCAAILGVTSNVAASEEIAQDVYLALWKNRSHVREGRAVWTWLRTTARNRALDYQRKAPIVRATDVSLLESLASTEESPDVTLARAQHVAFANAALTALPPDAREVMALHYREDLSAEEIAAFLEIPAATVRKRLSRARETMRSDLQHRMSSSLRNTAPAVALTAAIVSRLGSVEAGLSAAALAVSAAWAPLKIAALLIAALLGGGLLQEMGWINLGRARPLSVLKSPLTGATPLSLNHPEHGPLDSAAAGKSRRDEDESEKEKAQLACSTTIIDAVTRAPIVGGRVSLLEENADGPELRSAITDQDGAFSIDCADAETLKLRVRALGYDGRTTDARHAQLREGAPPPPPLALDPTVTYRGVVVSSASSEPLQGVSVSCRYELNSFSNPEDIHETKTSRDGTFKLTDCSARWHELLFSYPGYAAHVEKHEHAPGDVVTGLRVALGTGASIRGTVRDADGHPSPGATVFVAPGAAPWIGCTWRGPSAVPDPRNIIEVATADADARFSFTTLASGSYRVIGADVKAAHAATSVELEIGADKLIELQLARLQQVRGRVLSNGKPVAGVTVTIQPADEEDAPSSTPDEAELQRVLCDMPGAEFERVVSAGREGIETDAAGAFSFDGMPAVNFYATATSVGSGRGTAIGRPGAEIIIELGAATGAVAGRIIAGDRPARLDVIRVMAYQEASGLRWGTVSKDGQFEVHTLEPGEWSIRVLTSELAVLSQTVEVLPGRTSDVRFELPPIYRIRGQVLDDFGRPVRGASIKATSKSDEEGRRVYASNRLALSGPDGRFDGEGAADYVEIEHPDFTTKRVDIEKGTRTSDIELPPVQLVRRGQESAALTVPAP